MTSIHVTNISSQTSESELSSFFSFCGKITNISLTPVNNAQSATITFERASAAKTAVLLDGTPLHNSPLKVETAQSLDDISSPSQSAPHDDIPQDEKPRSAIFAEYLSHGYEIGENALHKAIEIDKSQGITAKFTQYLHTVLERTNAVDKAKSVDSSYHISEKADTARSTLTRYFEKALDTAAGQRVRSFYSDAEKQVAEIHAEATRLKELRQEKKRNSGTFGESADGKPFVGMEQTTCACGGKDSSCKCKQGQCACEGCGKSGVKEAQNKASAGGQFSHAAEDIKGTVKDVTQ